MRGALRGPPGLAVHHRISCVGPAGLSTLAAATLVVAGACNRADPSGLPPPRSISAETYDDWYGNAEANDDDDQDLMVGTWQYRTGWPYESVHVGPWWPVLFGSDPDPTNEWAASLSVDGRVIGGLKAYTSTRANRLVFSDYLPLDAAVAIRESPSDTQSVVTFPGHRFHGDHLIADGEDLTPLASSDWTADVRTVDDLRELERAHRDPLGTQLLNAAILGPWLVVLAFVANPALSTAVATVLLLIVVLVRSRRHPT